MTTTSVINIDLVNQTATNIFTLNNVVLNNVSFANNQITFNNRSSGSLNIKDLALNLTQLQVFKTALLFNFPILQSYINLSNGTSHYSIQRTDNTNIKYIFTGGALANIDNFTYDFLTKLCTITARTSPVTVSFSCYLQSLIAADNFLAQIRT